jgi:hypothetical protein
MQKPFLVACSGFINQEVTKKTIDSRFDLVVEEPLNMQTLKNQIIRTVLELKNKS